MRFTVEIRLGNAAMSSPDCMADALHSVEERLESFYASGSLAEWGGLSGGIFDANGNSVGRWAVQK